MNRAIVVLLTVQIVLLIMVLFSLWQLKHEANVCNHDVTTLRLPTQFVLQEPLCADRLLSIMGVDHVRVRKELPWNMSMPGSP